MQYVIYIVTDLLKALLDCLDSGHVVPEEDDVTVETAIIS
jgi:hypothetical protein